MSWRSSIARNRYPNVFDQNFSWYQDKPSDDPLRGKQKTQQQEPAIQTPDVSWQTAAPQETPAGKQRNAVWVLLLAALVAVVLFAFFAS